MNPLNTLNLLMSLKTMAQGNDSNAAAQLLLQQNPQLAQFVKENEGKPIEEVAKANGVDLNQLMSFLK